MIRKGEVVNQMRDCIKCEMTFASHHEQLNVCNDCLKENRETIKEIKQWKENEQSTRTN